MYFHQNHIFLLLFLFYASELTAFDSSTSRCKSIFSIAEFYELHVLWWLVVIFVVVVVVLMGAACYLRVIQSVSLLFFPPSGFPVVFRSSMPNFDLQSVQMYKEWITRRQANSCCFVLYAFMVECCIIMETVYGMHVRGIHSTIVNL